MFNILASPTLPEGRMDVSGPARNGLVQGLTVEAAATVLKDHFPLPLEGEGLLSSRLKETGARANRCCSVLTHFQSHTPRRKRRVPQDQPIMDQSER